MTDLTEKQIAEYADDTEIAGWLECYVDLALAQHERGDYINRSYRVALHAHAKMLRMKKAMELRVSAGHNDTCGSSLVPGSPCSCGHDQLEQALQEGSE